MFAINIEYLKKTKILYILKRALSLSVVYSKCGQEYEKIFKEEESIEILNILGLITNIEEYLKIYNHVWRKHEARIYTEKSRWNKKLFNWRNKSKWINE